jgi:hypothetical protein
MDHDTVEFVRDSIELLIRDRDEAFRYERLVRLYELQTWVHFPDNFGIGRTAVRIVGTRLLAEIENDYLSEQSDKEPGTAATLRALLRRPVYRNLFDETVGAHGGWTNLRFEMTPKGFDAARNSRAKANMTVAQLVDYRFRFLDQGGVNVQMANAAHAYVFRWNDKAEGRVLSGKTIRTRWTAGQEGAVFIYVSLIHRFQFTPRRLAAKRFLEGLRAEASRPKRLRRYFGMCAYVAERLYTSTREADILGCFPSAEVLERIHPETEPLSDEELKRLDNYKEDYLAFKDN